MNRTLIYTRTAEGAREIAAPTQELASNLGAILKAIDGESSVDALLGKFDHLSPIELGDALSVLTEKNFICLTGRDTTADGGPMPMEDVFQPKDDQPEKAVREAGERTRQEAETRALQIAEERAWRETEERIRRKEEEAAARRAKAKEVSRDRKTDMGILVKWGKVIALGIVVLVVAGLVAIHIVSFDGQIPQFEKSLSAQFQQPVKIAALRFSLLPQSQLRLEGVSIGDEGQIKIPKARAIGGIGSLFSQMKVFKSLEIESPVVNEEALGWFLFGKPQAPDVLFGQIKINGGTLMSQHIGLSPFDAIVQSDGEGAWKSIAIESQDKNINMEMTSKGDSVEIEFKAKTFKMPLGSKLVLDEVVASGTANRGGLVLKEFNGFVYGGTLNGNATLTWGASWSLAGEMNAKQIDTALLIPGVMDSARVAGMATYAMQATEAAKLFAATRMEGTFAIPRGTLMGVDIGRMLQGGDMRGETKLTDLSGSFVHDRGATQLRQVRLSHGSGSASGAADVDVDGNVNGRFAVDLKLSTEQRRASLGVGGSIKQIEWQWL